MSGAVSWLGWLHRAAAGRPYVAPNVELATKAPPDLQDCTDDAPDVHVFPDGWTVGHVTPHGDLAAGDDGLTVTVNAENRAAASTLVCPCWPTVTAVRAGASVGRRLTHHPMETP